jgi:phage head maturation protease
MSVAVAAEPSILAMRLVPFGAPQMVADVFADRTVVYFEQFDANSFDNPPARLPLLNSHLSANPIGWVERMAMRADGLDGEARLVGSPGEIANLRALIADDLLAGVSIGFAPNLKRDVWTKAGSNDRPPTVLRRGVRLREASLVLEAAYPSAKVTEIRAYTEAEAKRRDDHRRVDEEFRAMKAERRAKSREFLADMQRFVAEAEARGARYGSRQPLCAPQSDATASRAIPTARTDDVIGVERTLAGLRWVTWATATDEQRELYTRTGSIEATYE